MALTVRELEKVTVKLRAIGGLQNSLCVYCTQLQSLIGEVHFRVAEDENGDPIPDADPIMDERRAGLHRDGDASHTPAQRAEHAKAQRDGALARIRAAALEIAEFAQ